MTQLEILNIKNLFGVDYGTSNFLQGGVYSDSTYVVVGTNGTILTSSGVHQFGLQEHLLLIQVSIESPTGKAPSRQLGDWTTWTSRTSVTPNALRGVTYKE